MKIEYLRTHEPEYGRIVSQIWVDVNLEPSKYDYNGVPPRSQIPATWDVRNRSARTYRSIRDTYKLALQVTGCRANPGNNESLRFIQQCFYLAMEDAWTDAVRQYVLELHKEQAEGKQVYREFWHPLSSEAAARMANTAGGFYNYYKADMMTPASRARWVGRTRHGQIVWEWSDAT